MEPVRAHTLVHTGRPFGAIRTSRGASGARMGGHVKERARERRDRSIQSRVLGRLERVVTVLVEAGLQDRAAPPDLIERLRRLEFGLIASGEDRQALQVLASGRRLLGDAAELAPVRPTDIVSAEGPAQRVEIESWALRHDLPGN